MKHDSWSNLMFMLGKEIPLIGQTSLFPLVYTHAHVHKRSHIHVCIPRQSPWVLILYLSVITVCFLLHVVPNFSPFGLAPLSLSLLSSHPTLLCLGNPFLPAHLFRNKNNQTKKHRPGELEKVLAVRHFLFF